MKVPFVLPTKGNIHEKTESLKEKKKRSFKDELENSKKLCSSKAKDDKKKDDLAKKNSADVEIVNSELLVKIASKREHPKRERVRDKESVVKSLSGNKKRESKISKKSDEKGANSPNRSPNTEKSSEAQKVKGSILKSEDTKVGTKGKKTRFSIPKDTKKEKITNKSGNGNLGHHSISKANFMIFENVEIKSEKDETEKSGKLESEFEKLSSHLKEEKHENIQKVSEKTVHVQSSKSVQANLSSVKREVKKASITEEKKPNVDFTNTFTEKAKRIFNNTDSPHSNTHEVEKTPFTPLKTTIFSKNDKEKNNPDGGNYKNGWRKPLKFDNVVLKISRKTSEMEKIVLMKTITHKFEAGSSLFKEYGVLPQTQREKTHFVVDKSMNAKNVEAHSISKQILVAVSKALENQKPPLKIELHLNPPELGKITIKIVEKGGKTSLILNTESAKTHELMKVALPLMTFQLSNLNFNVVEIQLNGQQWMGNEGQNHRQKDDSERKHEKSEKQFSEEFKEFGKGEVL